MSNEATVKAIITNLESIVKSAPLSWELEDLSQDPEARHFTCCQLMYNGESFGDSFGEKPDYNEIMFQIRVERSGRGPDHVRYFSVKTTHQLRDNINVAALNVGDLAASKLVTRVEHLDSSITRYPLTTRVNYEIKVRYRES